MNVFIRRIGANPMQKLLIQMILIIYLSLHNLSCIFAIVSTDEMFGVLSYSSPLQHYLLSIYYVITVVTTTGYGDITPRNGEQIVFTIILIFCGNMIYAGTIGTISSWVGSTYSRVLEHFNQLKELEAFCKNKKLNPQLSEKILFQHNESFNQRSRQQTLRLFPDRLQKQCSFEIYGKFIKSFEYFSYLSSTQLSACVRNIQTQTYLKGDVILTRGDLNDKLHIIISGKVFLVKYLEKVNGEEAIPSRRSSLSTGEWFGDHSFFMAQPAAISAIAASDTVETMYIDRKVLLAILRQAKTTPQQLEKYFHHIQKTNKKEEEEVEIALNDEDEEAPPCQQRNTHPFIIFLDKLLSKNAKTERKPILHAAQFWKLSVEAIQRVMNQIQQSENDQISDAEEEDEEEYDDDENEWIAPQVSFYDGMFDDVDTKRIKEIKARFKNHDKHNTAGCCVM
eukprot:204965_1